jgi:hypothetical protein
LPPAPASGKSVSSGGPHPHFTSPPPQREPAKELKEDAAKKQPPRGEFGAGIF